MMCLMSLFDRVLLPVGEKFAEQKTECLPGEESFSQHDRSGRALLYFTDQPGYAA